MRRTDVAAGAVTLGALAFLAWGFAQAREARPALPDGIAEPAAIDGVARIEAGRYTSDPRDWDLPDAERIDEQLVAFDLDRGEVTERAWRACVDAGHCNAVASRGVDELPVTGVSAAEARDFCRAKGGDLPSTLQFGRAASGPTGARFPWGDVGPVCASAAWGRVDGPCAFDAPTPDVGGAHPRGSTVEGVHDLSGNVAEWAIGVDGAPEIRGGSFRDASPTGLKTRAARRAAPQERFDDVGFRCAFPVP